MASAITSRRKTDWSKCCLCQEDKKNEGLTSPSASVHQNPEHDRYVMIATNVPLFKEIGEMPLMFDPARLDEGSGIEATPRQNMAKYHKSCRVMFNNAKLDLARKRRSTVEGSEPQEMKAKQRRTSHDNEGCMFCEKVVPASDLRQVMTMNLNRRLHECAHTLNDGKLLAKLGAQELKYHR